MARADLLKQLFRTCRGSRRASFLDRVCSIAGEEHGKHQLASANELLRRGIRPTRQHCQIGGG